MNFFLEIWAGMGGEQNLLEGKHTLHRLYADKSMYMYIVELALYSFDQDGYEKNSLMKAWAHKLQI